jgi:hypothetical protein
LGVAAEGARLRRRRYKGGTAMVAGSVAETVVPELLDSMFI